MASLNPMVTRIFVCHLFAKLRTYSAPSFAIYHKHDTLHFAVPRVGRLCIICESSFNTGVYSLVVRAADWCIWKVTGPNPTRVQIFLCSTLVRHNEHFCLYLSLMSL